MEQAEGYYKLVDRQVTHHGRRGYYYEAFLVAEDCRRFECVLRTLLDFGTAFAVILGSENGT